MPKTHAGDRPVGRSACWITIEISSNGTSDDTALHPLSRWAGSAARCAVALRCWTRRRNASGTSLTATPSPMLTPPRGCSKREHGLTAMTNGDGLLPGALAAASDVEPP